jgi:hypothetical protein
MALDQVQPAGSWRLRVGEAAGRMVGMHQQAHITKSSIITDGEVRT